MARPKSPPKVPLISEQSAFPLRLLPEEREVLRQIAREEQRTLTAVVTRALRAQYPDRFPPL